MRPAAAIPPLRLASPVDARRTVGSAAITSACVPVGLADGSPGTLPELAGIGVTELVVAAAPPAEPANAAIWARQLAARWGVIPGM